MPTLPFLSLTPPPSKPPSLPPLPWEWIPRRKKCAPPFLNMTLFATSLFFLLPLLLLLLLQPPPQREAGSSLLLQGQGQQLGQPAQLVILITLVILPLLCLTLGLCPTLLLLLIRNLGGRSRFDFYSYSFALPSINSPTLHKQP